MTPTTPAAMALLQRAALQSQLNRYAFLQRQSAATIIKQVYGSK
jgi:hypothetical protein